MVRLDSFEFFELILKFIWRPIAGFLAYQSIVFDIADIYIYISESHVR